MSNWIGYAVSVNCGEPLGCYQGTILEADGTTITLTKAFRNGFPYPKAQVTLNAADIKDLKIIEARPEPAEQTHSTVAVTKSHKKGQRATVCENLQANPSSSGNQTTATASGSNNNKSGNSRTPNQGPARSKPIDIQSTRSNKNNTHAGSYGNTGSTPKYRGAGGGSGGCGGGGGGHEKARRRNEACFGEAADAALADDFDFEGNLALFDKQALWEQMRQSHRPDLVRQADELGKFRHDENVLGGPARAARHAVRVPDALRGELDYVTDDGLLVPSVVPHLRYRLWDELWRHEMGESALVLLARAAADVALRLVGGGRRLEPRNAHQAPRVVALLGGHAAGAAGALAARLLAAHGARAACHVAGAAPRAAALRRELAAAALAGVELAPSLDALPSADVLLLALHDVRRADAAAAPAAAAAAAERHDAALRWARAARAAVVALEPPAAGWPGVSCRAAVLALLPAALPAALGRVYLANVAPPLVLFDDLHITYRPPFGAAAVLALHAADDAD
ncbi:enhancer of mRNA-decapping protein 3 [Galleria mellonella]|uniref:Enhancer of mRNA-decapping protein 3 n=1 Tax=Galleria mellonella TaxID=7137 RepID=A0ABM3MWJ6_GALME|nr:enhancer of mRNA-decapping protein 3 [Galleria mellonella]